MPLSIRDLHTVEECGHYILERDVDIPLHNTEPDFPGDPMLVRANVYRPNKEGRFPVLATYGPYGKDIPYETFNPESYKDVNQNQKSLHAAWEVPNPAFWTANDYVVVRADERGTGNSPGRLDTMSKATCDGFFNVVEWCAEQPWSIGKVGLLGVSYYAGTQWRVAARKPKGLAAIIPWEGMSDYYRDRVRHGGILSNTFIKMWYDKQVGSNQYGLGGRTARGWGKDSLEGILSTEELDRNRSNQPEDTAAFKFRNAPYYSSKDFNLADIEVPVLSVANWGGILLHLRGNVAGYMDVSSKFKYLRFITGRHDIPFFYDEEVALQKSFLDAFLKGIDDRGWSIPGKIPPVDLCLRKGEPPYNDADAERKAFPRRQELEWPIARTKMVNYFLTASRTLSTERDFREKVLQYNAPSGDILFTSPPFETETEVTGHPIVRLSVSLSSCDGSTPSELDLFLTLRHMASDGHEIFYTGAVGDPVPVVKGWLRLSLRAETDADSPFTSLVPNRNYYSTDVQSVELDKVYTVDVELWPTNLVLSPGEKLVLQVASCDTQGSGVFGHDHPDDRNPENLRGLNNIHIDGQYENYLKLPIIPSRE